MDLFDSPPLQQPKSTARAEGRSLPFSEDGEKGVLCSLLLSPRDVLDLCQIKLRPEAFYTPAHQILFNLVAELVDSNKPIDFITLKQALKDRAQLDEIGGPEYLSDLFSFVPSAANADYYIDIIREKYLLRQLIVTCNRVVIGLLVRAEYYETDEEAKQEVAGEAPVDYRQTAQRAYRRRALGFSEGVHAV